MSKSKSRLNAHIPSQPQHNTGNAKGFNDSKPTHLAFLDGHIDGFNAGAKWAINEFLKDLWHPASEEPDKEGRAILFNCIDHDFVPSWCVYPIGFKGNWNEFCTSHGISKWLYIDDLL